MKKKRPAVFLDRDGVINRCPAGRYVTCWEEFRFQPGTLTALRQLKQKRKTVFIVSNQAGVGKGIMTREALNRTTRNMLRAIRAAGGTVRQVYYCTHRPEKGCGCRKPKPGMLRRAAREHGVDLARSVIVGDHEKDIQMGHRVGCRTLLTLSGITRRAAVRRMAVRPDRTVRNLDEAVRWILKQA